MAFMDGNGAQRERMCAASVLGLENGLEPVPLGACFCCGQISLQKACSAANRSHRKAKMMEKQKAFQLKPSSQFPLSPHSLARFSDRFRVVEEAAQAGKNLCVLMPDSACRQPWNPRDGFKARNKRSSPGKTQVSQENFKKFNILQPSTMTGESLKFDDEFRPGRAYSTSGATSQPLTVPQGLGQRGLPLDKFSGTFISEDEGPCTHLSLCPGRQSNASSKISLETRSLGNFQNREANFVRANGDHNSVEREAANNVDHRFCRENEPCLALSLTCVEHCKRFHAKDAISCINVFGCVNFEPKPFPSTTQVGVSDTHGKNIDFAKTSADQALVKRVGLFEKPTGRHPLTAGMPLGAVQIPFCSDASRSKLQFSFNGENSGSYRPLTSPQSEIQFKEASVARGKILRRRSKKSRATVISKNRGFYYRLLGSLGSSIPSKIDKSNKNLSVYNINSSNAGNEDGKSRSFSVEAMRAKAQTMEHLPVMAPPLIRSKRGRSQNLPSRFSDSVLGCWKRQTRQKS